MFQKKLHVRVAFAALIVLLAPGPASVARGAEELTEEKLEQLRFSALTEPPARMVRKLGPYLEDPDSRLAPLLAGVLARGEDLGAQKQARLFEALREVADRSVFPGAKKLLQSTSPVRTRYGIVLLGRSGHPEAHRALIDFYGRTEDVRRRLEMVRALGELGDRGATEFLTEVAESEHPGLRDEAVLARARCGARVPAGDLLEVDARTRATMARLRKNLDYTRREHPEEYRQRMRKLEELDGRLERLGNVLESACRERPLEVVEALRRAEDAEMVEAFAPYLEMLVGEAPAGVLVPLLREAPRSFARRMARRMRAEGGAAREVLEGRLERWRESGEAALVERAAALSGGAAGRVRLDVPPDLPPDETHPGPAFPYILWDGHRFGAPERDVRYYRDLGFTHSHVGASVYAEPGAEKAERLRRLFSLFDRHEMFVGLRFGWDFSGLGGSWQDMMESGLALRSRRGGDHSDYNPLHPDLIRHYGRGVVETVDALRALDAGDRIKLLLVGSERTWGLPDRKKVPEAAARLILETAREDGAPGANEDDWSGLKRWWAGPHEKGRDYRLREAYEEAVLDRIPDARFWVDPIWAIKIVHGFGGTWTYIGEDPKGIAVAVARLKAMCRPAPCAHSTQLIRGAHHDTLMEANLLSICMGAEMLYHWGINTFEPGREADPTYGQKDVEPTPEGFPWFRAGHFPGDHWERFVKRLYEEREEAPVSRLWSMLPEKVRGRVEDAVMFGGGGGDDLFGEVGAGGDFDDLKKPLIGALNDVLSKPGFYDAEGFDGLDPGGRIRELLERREGRGGLVETDRAELNRLLIERMFGASPARRGQPPTPAAVPRTPEPNLRMMRERIRGKRRMKEPAIRSTGRLLRERGALFRDWEPLGSRVALLCGIYGDADTVLGLLVGHVPFDILRNRRDRLARLARYDHAAVAGKSMEAEVYRELLEVDRAGGRIFLPEGFEPPEGLERPRHAVEWDPHPTGGLARRGEKRRRAIRETARAFRRTFHGAGVRSYFDTGNPEVIMRGYVHEGLRMLFVVNDRREPAGEGRPNEVTVSIADGAEGLRVIDIDTGREVEARRTDAGWEFGDTIPAAWYRIYAVVPGGEDYDGPAPLPPGPDVENLRASRADGGVRLRWDLTFEDWVGCDLARYRIYRAAAGGDEKLLADIPGRIFEGPGGVVREYVDEDAEEGERHFYRVQTVTPLRRRGPLSERVGVGP